MNEESLNIIVLSAQSMITNIENELARLNCLRNEEMDIFSWFASQFLEQQERGKILLNALNDVFKRVVHSGLDTVQLTGTIHQLELLMISLNREIYQEVDMSQI